MLSGIGDPAVLNPLSISLVKNNTFVGKNLQDHPLAAQVWNVNTTSSFDDIYRNQTLENQYNTHESKPKHCNPFRPSMKASEWGSERRSNLTYRSCKEGVISESRSGELYGTKEAYHSWSYSTE